MTATTIQSPKTMKSFVIIWLGQVISMVGSGLTSFALSVYLFQVTGKATPFTLAVLFSNLPRILLSPIAGSLADRWNRKLLMILSDTCNALITLLLAFLLAGGSVPVLVIYGILILYSIFSAFQEPAYTASITMLVPKDDLARAAGMMQVGQSFEMLLSPVLAGFLYVFIGFRGIILIDFVTYFFALAALVWVRIPQPAREAEEEDRKTKGKVWADLRFGWNYLRVRRGLFGLLWYFAVVNFLLNFGMVLSGPLVLSFSDASSMGVVEAIGGVGMLIGGAIMSAWGGPKQRIRGIYGGIAIMAGSLLLIGLRAFVPLIAVGFFLMSFSLPLASASSQAIFQSKVAPNVQGRVFAIRSMISRSVMPLASLTAGPLADYFFEPLMQPDGALGKTFLGGMLGAGAGRGMGLMFVVSGIFLLLVTAYSFTNPHIRRIETDLPDAVADAAAVADNAAVADTAAGASAQENAGGAAAGDAAVQN